MSNSKTKAPLPTDEQITDQIIETRNIDAETSKPKLQKPSTYKDNKEEKKALLKTKMNKPTPSTSTFQIILTPYLRYPLEGVTRPVISTYVPDAHMMYYIIHLMDVTLRRNTNFRKLHDDWYPLISRIYFGIIFIIQTLRAENSITKLSIAHRKFLTEFLKDYPPESLPIPGPLVTLFESLTATRPSNSLEGCITPTIPTQIGPANAQALITYDQANTHQLMLPNIPLLVGFANSVINAAAGAIPNYADPATSFANNVDRTINGHIFNANAWTPTDRSALMVPGQLYPVETDDQMNTHFNIYGKRLTAQMPITTVKQFTCMQTSNSWFGNILPIMETYCSFFNGSSTLQQCTTSISAAPLIISEHHSLSAPLDTNNFGHLTHGFPSDTPLSFEARHCSAEIDLPPAASMLAQASQLNVRTTATDEIGLWNNIGHLNITRFGPYWRNNLSSNVQSLNHATRPSAPSFPKAIY